MPEPKWIGPFLTHGPYRSVAEMLCALDSQWHAIWNLNNPDPLPPIRWELLPEGVNPEEEELEVEEETWENEGGNGLTRTP
jgi:hypothetical protein